MSEKILTNVLLIILLCWDFFKGLSIQNINCNVLKLTVLSASIWTDLVQSLVTPSNSFHLTFDFPLFLIGQNMIQRPRIRRSIPSTSNLKQKNCVKNMILSKNKLCFSSRILREMYFQKTQKQSEKTHSLQSKN